MLYQISPPATITWSDMPHDTIELAAENNVDLARLEWQPIEEPHVAADVLRIALRHGVTCSTGIVIHPRYITDLGSGDKLRESARQLNESSAKLRDSNPMMERLFPGWKAHGEELDRAVAESTERTAQERDAQAAAYLAAAEQHTLVEHWERLGGELPDPR